MQRLCVPDKMLTDAAGEKVVTVVITVLPSPCRNHCLISPCNPFPGFVALDSNKPGAARDSSSSSAMLIIPYDSANYWLTSD